MTVTPAPLSEIRAWAYRYAAAGLFPIELVGPTVPKSEYVKSPGKQPGHKGWQSEAQPLHPDTYRDGCNLGLRMGRQTNGAVLVCIDVDAEDPAVLLEIHPTWPATLIQRTGKGRWHFLYVWPASVPLPGNKIQLHDRQGGKIPVDIRADGGQIVVTPSVHPETGTPYQWLNAGTSPVDLPEEIAQAVLAAGHSPGTRTSSKSTVASRVSPPPSADAETVAAASSSPGAVSFEVSDIQWKRVCRKLAQRNSPVAAAFERLLRGQSLAEPGERDGKITSMCWALARELPEADPDGIARFFEQSLSLMHSLSPFNAPCDVALKFRTAVHKQQNETAEVCLQCSSTGAPKANVENCLRVLRGDQNLYGRFVYDEFADRVIVARPTPWDKPALRYPRAVTNEDFTMLEAYLSSAHHLDVKSTSVFAAACAVARENGFHPAREYIFSVVPKWDGVPRIDTWLVDYCGAQDCQTTRWAAAWWLMSAVERIADPGCQADYCLVLEGQQGRKKSTALRVLASPDWFTDDMPDIANQVASAQALSGKWIVELSELASVRSAKDVDRTKAFLSRKVDRYRVPYGKVTQDFPRQCVFAGSTNDTEYLTDPTGNRRFWAVRVSDKDVDVGGLRAVRDQLWAEAAIRYAAGEQHWPETETEKAMFAATIETRRVHDSWIDKVLTWCSNPIGYRGQPLTTAFLLESIFEIRASRRQDDQRLSSCLQSLGWGKTVAPGGFRYWIPPGEGLSVTNNVFPLRSVS